MVLGTHPDAGSHLLGGKLVQLVVSKGAERYVVPAGRRQELRRRPSRPSPACRCGWCARDTADGTGKIAAGR